MPVIANAARWPPYPKRDSAYNAIGKYWFTIKFSKVVLIWGSLYCMAFVWTLIYSLLIGFGGAVQNFQAYIKELPSADAEAKNSAARESDTGSFESAQL